jgi:selenocysteine-specific elongation factor
MAGAGGTLVEQVVALIERAGLTPPSVVELIGQLGEREVPDALRLAERDGRLVAVERDRYYSLAALQLFRDALSRIGREGAISPAAVREATGVSRKFLIPLLEWADRSGHTVRRGDVRLLAGAPAAKT